MKESVIKMLEELKDELKKKKYDGKDGYDAMVDECYMSMFIKIIDRKISHIKQEIQS